MTLFMCWSCRLEVYEYDTICPRCKSADIRKVVYEREPIVTLGDKSRGYVNGLFAETEGLLLSEHVCFCGQYHKRHYMVWPRKTINEQKVNITKMAFCPFRIEKYSGITLDEKSIEKLEVSNA